MMKNIITLQGMFSSNTYLLDCGKGEGVLIDAGADCGEVLDAASKAGISLRYVILTHAHIDHIVSAEKLRERAGANVLIHKDDSDILGDALKNGSELFGPHKVSYTADKLLSDAETITCGDETLVIMHTPGHTPGCICIKCDGVIFTGDTLFRLSIGRSDLYGGDASKLALSLKKLMTEDDEVKIYPGHGKPTSIGFEKKHNPYSGWIQ